MEQIPSSGDHWCTTEGDWRGICLRGTFTLNIGREDTETWLAEQDEAKSPQSIGQAPAISSRGKAKAS
jgi:hypothetical protein